MAFSAQLFSQFPCGKVNCEVRQAVKEQISCNLCELPVGRLLIFFLILLFQQEFLSDQVTPGLPGLADLGVEPSALETIAISVLRRHRDVFFFDDAMDSDAPCRPTSSYATQ